MNTKTKSQTATTRALAALLALTLGLASAHAVQNTLGSGVAEDWFSTSNWTNGAAPSSTDPTGAQLLINNGTSVTFNASSLIDASIFDNPTGTFSSNTAAPGTTNLPYYLYGSGQPATVTNKNDAGIAAFTGSNIPFAIGVGDNSGNNTFNLTAGALGVGNYVTLGAMTSGGTTQTLNVGGGANKALLVTGYLNIGAGNGSSQGGNSIVNINNNGKIVLQQGLRMAGDGFLDARAGYGFQGNATLNINAGGILQSLGNVDIGYAVRDKTAVWETTININGGTLDASERDFAIGRSGTDTSASSKASINLSSGSLVTKSIYLGRSSGIYSLNQTGGCLTLANEIYTGTQAYNSVGTGAPEVTIALGGGTMDARRIILGQSVGGNFSLTQTAGVLTLTDYLFTGTDSGTLSDTTAPDSASVNLNGGTMNVKGLALGYAMSGNHTFTLNAGATLNINSGTGDRLQIGNLASGTDHTSNSTFIQNGGTVNLNGQLWIGYYGGDGVYKLNGGILNVGNHIRINYHRSQADQIGRLEIDGGTLNMTMTAVSGGDIGMIDLGYNSTFTSGNAPAELLLKSGGVIGSGSVRFGRQGNLISHYTQTGGSFSGVAFYMGLAANTVSNATITGGTLNLSGDSHVGDAGYANSSARLEIGGSAQATFGNLVLGLGHNTKLTGGSGNPSSIANNGGTSTAIFQGSSITTVTGLLSLAQENSNAVANAILRGSAKLSAAKLKIGFQSALTFEIGPSGFDATLSVTGTDADSLAIEGFLNIDLSGFTSAFAGTRDIVLMTVDASTSANLSDVLYAVNPYGEDSDLISNVAIAWLTGTDALSGKECLTLTLTGTAVPEPATTAALLGLLALTLLLRRRK
jgi:hypothetical protein